MALFPGVQGSLDFKGKTHTGLVVSEGNAPSEKFIVSKNEAVKFNYFYGPEGNQNVVIAKGKAVEFAGIEYDYETSRNQPAIKTAASGTLKTFGVNHHNLYERKRDRFSGNQPTIITRQYIELPFFEAGSGVDAAADLVVANGFANAMQFGAVYGSTKQALTHGDYVKVGANGNFTKFIPGTDDPLTIVGQAWAVEKELPPAGLLAYYMDTKIEELEAFLKAASYAPSPGKNGAVTYDNPTAGDAGAYPFGYPWALSSWKGTFEDLLLPATNKGIPFLTDGYFKSKAVRTGVSIADIYDVTSNNDGLIEAVTVSGNVTITNTGTTDADAVVAADTRNNAIFIKLRGTIDRVEQNAVVVKVGATTHTDVHFDYTNNTVVVYLEAGQTYNNIALDLKLIVDPIAGVPTEWDHAGAVGAVRILLQK
jgi:hypothetical protein